MEGLTPTRTRPGPAGAQTLTISQVTQALPQEFRDFIGEHGALSDEGTMMTNATVQTALRERFGNSPQQLREHVYRSIYDMCIRVYTGRPQQRAGRDRARLRDAGIAVSGRNVGTGTARRREMQIAWTRSRMNAASMQTMLMEIIRLGEIRTPAAPGEGK
jgi:hypothetical protein